MGEPSEEAIPKLNGPGVDGARKTGKRKRIIIVAAIVVLAVIAAGGMVGWKAYRDRRVSVARSDCRAALVRLDRAAKTYAALLKADDTTAALKIKAADVKDAKTVSTLAAAARTSTPKRVACSADNTTALDGAKDSADRATARYGRMTRSLDRAVKAVESSKMDKTVADATKLLNDTKGRVKDEKTRESLAKAVKARDAQAIAKAVKTVNDSRAAKEKADAEATAKAKQEARAAVPQSSNAGNTYSSGNTGYSYSGGTGYSSGTYSGNGGYSYSGGSGRSYSNGTGGNGGAASSGGNSGSTSSGGQSTAGGSNSSSNSSGSSSNTPEWGGGCEVSDETPSCSWGMNF